MISNGILRIIPLKRPNFPLQDYHIGQFYEMAFPDLSQVIENMKQLPLLNLPSFGQRIYKLSRLSKGSYGRLKNHFINIDEVTIPNLTSNPKIPFISFDQVIEMFRRKEFEK